MKTFKIEVTETLSKIVEVSAENIEDALHKTKKLYNNEKIILDENNHVTTEFKKMKL